MALRSSAVRLGEAFAGIYRPETIERFGLLASGMLTEWASWRWVMYVNATFAAPAPIGALLPAKPMITQKLKLGIPGIVAVGEGRPATLDNSVQNRLGF
ncbi:hypothetical protein ABZ464_51390 [Streptomyces sp. NPDC005820]|uniref:hypothetical protein n=1 Tax=Streptomyces sp. NPDC005820 TaxID=3157069 RepID=UPI0033FA500C